MKSNRRPTPKSGRPACASTPPPLCSSIRPLLLAYMSRELDSAPSALVREHLRICRACAAEAAEIQHALEVLRATDPAPAKTAETLAPRRRARTLWLMEHPIVAWFFLHRRITGIICAVIVMTLVFFALMLIKGEDIWSLRRIGADIGTPIRVIAPTPHSPVQQIDEPPLE